MVTITNGKDVFSVTKGAFESIYKKQGFKIAKAKKEKPVEMKTEHKELTDEEFIEKLDEKPLNHWNKADVKRFASIFGIDISATKNINEARDLIRDFKEVEENAEDDAEEEAKDEE